MDGKRRTCLTRGSLTFVEESTTWTTVSGVDDDESVKVELEDTSVSSDKSVESVRVLIGSSSELPDRSLSVEGLGLLDLAAAKDFSIDLLGAIVVVLVKNKEAENLREGRSVGAGAIDSALRSEAIVLLMR
jgi:hypothetical protein